MKQIWKSFTTLLASWWPSKQPVMSLLVDFVLPPEVKQYQRRIWDQKFDGLSTSSGSSFWHNIYSSLSSARPQSRTKAFPRTSEILSEQTSGQMFTKPLTEFDEMEVGYISGSPNEEYSSTIRQDKISMQNIWKEDSDSTRCIKICSTKTHPKLTISNGENHHISEDREAIEKIRTSTVPFESSSIIPGELNSSQSLVSAPNLTTANSFVSTQILTAPRIAALTNLLIMFLMLWLVPVLIPRTVGYSKRVYAMRPKSAKTNILLLSSILLLAIISLVSNSKIQNLLAHIDISQSHFIFLILITLRILRSATNYISYNHLKKPVKVCSKAKITSQDLTIILPWPYIHDDTFSSANPPTSINISSLKSLARAGAKEIIIYSPNLYAWRCATQIASPNPSNGIRTIFTETVISDEERLVHAIKSVTTPYVAVVSTPTVLWPKGFLNSALSQFEKSDVGMIIPPLKNCFLDDIQIPNPNNESENGSQNRNKTSSWKQTLLKDFKILETYMYNYIHIATSRIDHQISPLTPISLTTTLYRTHILQTLAFRETYQQSRNDTSFIPRYIQSQHFRIAFLDDVPSAMVSMIQSPPESLKNLIEENVEMIIQLTKTFMKGERNPKIYLLHTPYGLFNYIITHLLFLPTLISFLLTLQKENSNVWIFFLFVMLVGIKSLKFREGKDLRGREERNASGIVRRGIRGKRMLGRWFFYMAYEVVMEVVGCVVVIDTLVGALWGTLWHGVLRKRSN